MTDKRLKTLCILSLVLSLSSVVFSFVRFHFEEQAIKAAVYQDIVQEVEEAIVPFYETAQMRMPTKEERKTIKGVLRPLFLITSVTK